MHSGQTRGERRAKRSTRRQLDALIVNIELTLTSIIQGVALSVLSESSRAPLGDLRFDQWPYVVNGLLVILLFWSRSMAHTLTLIRWPLEFAHNFLYFTCTLIEAIIFTDLTDPLRWYAFSAAFAVSTWFLFLADLRLIRQHQHPPLAGGPDPRRRSRRVRSASNHYSVRLPDLRRQVLCDYCSDSSKSESGRGLGVRWLQKSDFFRNPKKRSLEIPGAPRASEHFVLETPNSSMLEVLALFVALKQPKMSVTRRNAFHVPRSTVSSTCRKSTAGAKRNEPDTGSQGC